MTKLRRLSIWLILLCNGISIVSGVALDRSSAAGMMNFRAVYFGARCLLQHSDPYKSSEFLHIYRVESGEFPRDPAKASLFLRAVPVCVNLPTTLFLLAPLAMLGWWPAHIIWLILIGMVFTGASLLAWDLAAEYAPIVSLVLICALAINNEVLFIVGNTAAIAIGLCVAAVWCFVKGRFAVAGVVCLAMSLAIKPHDSGLVWLYFLLAGGILRKRALQSLVLTALLAIPAVLWVSMIAPDWRQELQANLSTTSSHGDISDPGPDNASRGTSADVLIDLQTVISVFKDEPRIYNAVSYLICGSLLLVWSITTLRSQAFSPHSWFALASIAALSILATYHRPYDAKILLLTVPACALLWSQGGANGRIAFVLTLAGVLVTGDIPLAILSMLTRPIDIHTLSTVEKSFIIPILRPVPIVLLLAGGFYLWQYVVTSSSSKAKTGRVAQEPARTPSI
jgi:hypothetical protein